MARGKKVFTVVDTEAADGVSIDEMGEEELKAFLGEREDAVKSGAIRVIAGKEISVRVETRTEVTLGDKAERKPRASKATDKKNGKKAGTTVGAEFFDKPTNGTEQRKE